MRKLKKVISIITVIMLCFSLLPFQVLGSSGLAVNELSSSEEVDMLVNTLLGGGVVFSNVSFKGKAGEGASAGTFSGGTGIFGFESGLVLSTGNIKNIIGPNIKDGIGVDLELPGDSDLQNLANEVTYDATVLEFDFVPNTDEISFQYQFASDEYNEYVFDPESGDEGINDVFGFYLNNINIALIPGTDNAVSINNINKNKNSNFYINNDISDVEPDKLINTEMDGMTVILTANAKVNKGVTNHIKLAVADAVDSVFDSVVIIKAGSFVSDDTPPILNIPEDKTVFATGEKTIVDIGAATASDDTTPSGEIEINNNAPLDGFLVGTTAVVWTATDLSGNSVSKTQYIKVISPEEAVEINVWKNWESVGPASKNVDGFYDYPDIVINLLVNKEKVQSAILGSENDFHYKFIAPKYDDNKNEIVYSIEEESIENYVSVVKYYKGEGYAVYNLPCIDIPVKKLWIGPVGKEAEVNLYANGEPTDYVLKLNKENQWKNTFKIPLLDIKTFNPIEWIYDVEFTVQETSQKNYETVVDGDAIEGFTITNTYNGPLDGYNYAVINWLYETGYDTNEYNIKYSETTSTSAITADDIEYYKNLHYDSGYTFVSSYVESENIVVIIGETSTGTAITGSAIKFTSTLKYDKNGSGGGSSGGSVSRKSKEPELEKYDHFAYILGYHEGDIKPLNKITREEVAMIFYRLLTDETRIKYLSDVSPFTDLENHEWSQLAISTLYKANIINGYPDGTFRPSDPISRAEFATIAAKFDKLELQNTTKFTDIFGHWAEKYITSSEIKGWIKGYPDMTFRPEQDITRAESMTLINNVLERLVPEENIHPDAMFWPDIKSDDWYYEAVMEATNSHDYVYEEEGDELWTGIKANKVWP